MQLRCKDYAVIKIIFQSAANNKHLISSTKTKNNSHSRLLPLPMPIAIYLWTQALEPWKAVVCQAKRLSLPSGYTTNQ